MELTRQSSRFAEIHAYLEQVVGLPSSKVGEYAEGLVEQGYDSVSLFDDLTVKELQDDYGFLKGHALKVEKSQMERRVGRFGPHGDLEPEPEVVLELDVSTLEAELLGMRPAALVRKAGNMGVAEHDIDTADEQDDRKSALITLILKHAREYGVNTSASSGLVGSPSHHEPHTGEPAGTCLDDGSTVELTTPEEILGQGGSGIVRGAVRTRRNGASEQVACKMLLRSADEVAVQKLAKEYTIALRASQICAGACRIYGMITIGGDLCLVMKRYERDFDALIRSRPLELRDCVEYGLQVACALVELHSAGIVVRDLKPGNLLVDTDGKLVISDFGIAALLDSATGTTTAGDFKGTPQYSSPEQFDPEMPVKEPSDVWAWGCIMVQMLTGKPPWPTCPTTYQLVNLIANKKKSPELPTSLDAPSELRQLVHRCLSHNPTDRPLPKEIAVALRALVPTVASSRTAELDPNRPTSLRSCGPSTEVFQYVDSLLQNTWVKRDEYEFTKLLDVKEVDNPRLKRNYEAYKESLPADVLNGNEVRLFHGCAESVIESICELGLQKKYWKSAAGSWQRFGPGFYFALQASKSHDYPLGPMRALRGGKHTRSMILFKVAKGHVYTTRENMDHLTGAAPQSFHSVHGMAATKRDGGRLNYDELVVYEEAAMLPYAVVTYSFKKMLTEKQALADGKACFSAADFVGFAKITCQFKQFRPDALHQVAQLPVPANKPPPLKEYLEALSALTSLTAPETKALADANAAYDAAVAAAAKKRAEEALACLSVGDYAGVVELAAAHPGIRQMALKQIAEKPAPKKPQARPAVLDYLEALAAETALNGEEQRAFTVSRETFRREQADLQEAQACLRRTDYVSFAKIVARQTRFREPAVEQLVALPVDNPTQLSPIEIYLEALAGLTALTKDERQAGTAAKDARSAAVQEKARRQAALDSIKGLFDQRDYEGVAKVVAGHLGFRAQALRQITQLPSNKVGVEVPPTSVYLKSLASHTTLNQEEQQAWKASREAHDQRIAKWTKVVQACSKTKDWAQLAKIATEQAGLRPLILEKLLATPSNFLQQTQQPEMPAALLYLNALSTFVPALDAKEMGTLEKTRAAHGKALTAFSQAETQRLLSLAASPVAAQTQDQSIAGSGSGSGRGRGRGGGGGRGRGRAIAQDVSAGYLVTPPASVIPGSPAVPRDMTAATSAVGLTPVRGMTVPQFGSAWGSVGMVERALKISVSSWSVEELTEPVQTFVSKCEKCGFGVIQAIGTEAVAVGETRGGLQVLMHGKTSSTQLDLLLRSQDQFVCTQVAAALPPALQKTPSATTLYSPKTRAAKQQKALCSAPAEAAAAKKTAEQKAKAKTEAEAWTCGVCGKKNILKVGAQYCPVCTAVRGRQPKLKPKSSESAPPLISAPAPAPAVESAVAVPGSAPTTLQGRHSAARTNPVWVVGGDKCMQCGEEFSFFKRRHHCRACGWVLCSDCAPEDQTRYLMKWLDDDEPHSLKMAENGRLKSTEKKRVCNLCVGSC